MPKSGGWLNSVKVVFAFILLGFSLKFLVSIDQSYHFNIISREVFLAIWIVISIILGFYLLGKIRFSHDSEIKFVSVPRLFLAIGAFTFSIYLATGYFGSSIPALASILPPATEKNISISAPQSENNTNSLCNTPKYADLFHLPYGLQGYFDYSEGLACAQKQNKPVFFDFKGYSCSNCKVMEAQVWSNPQVQKLLRDEFIIVALYTDDHTQIPVNEQIVSKIDGRKKKTIGQLNADIQISLFKSNALPLYAITDTKGNILIKPIGFENDVNKFVAFLNAGLQNFKKNQ
jgi:thiol:disulfide interchange protein DsbD